MFSCGEAASDEGGGSSSTASPDADIACGELVCSDGDVCVVDVYEPSCTSVESFDVTCPEGGEPSSCGGAGGPCCCGATPMPQQRCFTPASCDGPASCECLGEELCTGDRACVPFADEPERFFRCETYEE